MKHKCQQSPSITKWSKERSKEWSDERTRRLKLRISQEYDRAIKACDEARKKQKISEAPEPIQLGWVVTSNAGPFTTNNAPASLDTYSNNDELLEDHQIAAQLSIRDSAKKGDGADDTALLTGEIVPGTGHFCIDDAGTLETAHNFGFFCLDDTEALATATWDAGILNQDVWNQVLCDSTLHQDQHTQGRGTGSKKRPPSMIY